MKDEEREEGEREREGWGGEETRGEVRTRIGTEAGTRDRAEDKGMGKDHMQ